MTNKDLEILNSLSDRDIVCWLYFSCLKVKIRDIARHRGLNRGVVFYSIKKFRKIDRQEELIAIIQELFNDDRH
jgi:hypothetical protein